MDIKFKLLRFLFLFIIVSNFLLYPYKVEAAVSSDTQLVFIGDSRTDGMKDLIKKDGYLVIAKTGKGYSYLKSDVLNSLKSKINNDKSKKNWIIVSCFGVNDLSNINKYESFYKSLVSKLPSGNKYSLCLAPVFQVNETKMVKANYKTKKGESKVKNKSVNNFNTKLSSLQDTSNGIYYLSNLDISPTPRETIKGYLGKDGLHFTDDGYKYIYGQILSSATTCSGNFSSASTTSNSNSSQLKLSDEEIKSIQKEMSISDDTLSTYKAIWDGYLVSGLTEQAIAGIFGNLYAESSLSGACVESGNTGQGIGIAQWSGDNRKRLQEWSSKCGHNTVSAPCAGGPFKICTDAVCQSAFLLKEMSGDWMSTYVKKYNETAKGYSSVPQNVEVYTDFDSFKTAKDIDGAAISMFDCYERGAGISVLMGKDPNAIGAKSGGKARTNAWWFEHEHKGRSNNAEKLYKLFSGSSISASEDASQSVVNTMVSSGIWGEEEFNLYCNLTEIELQYPSRDSLSSSELKGVVDWKNNVEYKKENAIVRFFRKAVVMFGILLIIYTIFIYLAYWFDRINTFFDFEMLKKITFDKLAVSPDEDECTFDPRGLKNHGDLQTVNHRMIVGICLTSIFFSVLIISGKIYDIIGALIRFIMNLLGI